MFDSTPANLPIEPVNPPQAPSQPPPAAYQPQKAINTPGVKEPEDIFAEIKEPELGQASTSAPQSYASSAPTIKGFPWRVVLGIGIPLVVLGLGLGIWYVYGSYQKANNTVTPPVAKENQPNIPVTNAPDNTPGIQNPVTPPDEEKMAAQQAAMTLLQMQAEKGYSGDASTTDIAALAATATAAVGTPVAPPNVPLPTSVTETETVSVPLVPGLDSDGDGLINTEEVLLGSDPNLIDTNGNKYPDRTEIINGYDPVKAGGKLSSSSYLKAELIGTLEVLIPKTWERKPGPGGTVQILTGTPAVMTAEIRPFATDKTLLDMVIQDNPGTTSQDYAADKTKSGLDVVYSQDGMSAWVLAGNSVYLFRYNTNGATSKDFESIFKLILVRQARIPNS
jgi:hypothetical protein